MNQATTNANVTAINARQIAGMGLADIKAAVTANTMTENEALSVLHARIQKRIANKQNLIPAIVEFNNQLATLLNLPAMVVPVPNYGSQAATIKVTGSSQSDIDKLAADIMAANVDLPKLMTALAQHVNKKAA